MVLSVLRPEHLRMREVGWAIGDQWGLAAWAGPTRLLGSAACRV